MDSSRLRLPGFVNIEHCQTYSSQELTEVDDAAVEEDKMLVAALLDVTRLVEVLVDELETTLGEDDGVVFTED